MDIESSLEAERACAALSHAFAYHFDRLDYQSLAQLFVPNGIWIRHGVSLEGPDQIIAALNEQPANQITRNIAASIHFTTTGPELARAVVCNISYFNPDSSDIPATLTGDRVMVIDFEDTYIRTGDGWRFLKRDTRPILIPDNLRAIVGGEH